MEDLSQHIDFELAAKYLANECSGIEIQKFEKWLASREENQQEFDALKAIFEVDQSAPAIDVDAAWNNVNAKTGTNVRNIDSSRPIRKTPVMMSRIAAAITVIMGISAALWFMKADALQELRSGDQMANITLDDGTEVSMNAHSILSYPESFDGNTREVTLSGDQALSGIAFFKVAANKAKPFIIHTSGGDIEVVGTQFEVQTDMSDLQLRVSVEEGIVEVSNEFIDESARVTAGQIAAVQVSAGEIKVVENESVAPFFWKDKTIKFKRTQLSKVVESLNTLLQMNIELGSDDLSKCELTVTFTNEQPETIAEIIAMTLGLEVKRNGDTYILSGTGCNYG
ncbi:FecR domain-containing protein [Salibacteraceae bacterium]|nr:FecR domain-containing protein [Salibacteraceae bacterium]